MKIHGLLILIFAFFSCQSESDKLFWINENTEYESDFLYMAESTNILPIRQDSLIFYLTKEEFLAAEKLTFKNFGTIHISDNFRVVVLFKKGSKTGRDYSFIIRTFNDSKIIDSFEFAHWIEADNKYCFGSINKNLIIEKRCKDSNNSEIMQITKSGKIIATSFHKP